MPESTSESMLIPSFDFPYWIEILNMVDELLCTAVQTSLYFFVKLRIVKDNNLGGKGKSKFVFKAITLGQAKFFLDNFKGEYFEVTDFLVAHEGVIAKDALETPSFILSPASGIKISDYQALSDDQKDEIVMDNKIISSVAWLLEREWSNIHFRKYSGTLEHPHHTDKQGATINVFQHFTYLNSNKALVLADIQGSKSHNPSNKAGILFDLMSHTQYGDSGAGHHSDDGIQSFVVQHKCGQICIQMGLEKLGETEEEEY
ncbi:kinase-like domain-containing protein [Mycena olivaceomarginata]|nr:kinase-like domain-containing protein [Mycena olivaceomarginata]